MPPLDQLVMDGVEEDPPHLASDQAGSSAPTETTAVEPSDLDQPKMRCPAVIPYVKGVSE